MLIRFLYLTTTIFCFFFNYFSYHQIVLAALVAVAAAAPSGLVASPVVSAYSAPVVAAPLPYSAYSAPLAYSGYAPASLAYSAPLAYKSAYVSPYASAYASPYTYFHQELSLRLCDRISDPDYTILTKQYQRTKLTPSRSDNNEGYYIIVTIMCCK